MFDQRLRVGLVATSIGKEGGGLARYAGELLAALHRRDDVDVTPIVAGGGGDIVRNLAPGARPIEVPYRSAAGRVLWELYRVGGLADRLGFDLLHCTRNVAPAHASLPVVLTVHDVMNLTWPQQFPALKRAFIPRQFRLAIRRADSVIAISHATADRLARVEPSSASKTRVVPLGVPRSLRSTASVPIESLTHRRFVLAVGELNPRKNLDLLFRVWPRVVEVAGDVCLVIIGPDGWRDAEIQTRLARLVDAGLAMRPGYVDDAALRWCYEHAQALLCPSFEEGFGLPVAEAVGFGTPTIASTDPALIETSAGRAVHVDPRDEEAWIREIVHVLATEDHDRGPRPDGFPSWDQVAARTVEAYRDVVARDKVGVR